MTRRQRQMAWTAGLVLAGLGAWAVRQSIARRDAQRALAMRRQDPVCRRLCPDGHVSVYRSLQAAKTADPAADLRAKLESHDCLCEVALVQGHTPDWQEFPPSPAPPQGGP
jgi:hypothetical protein